jgi:hypothetical protein
MLVFCRLRFFRLSLLLCMILKIRTVMSSTYGFRHFQQLKKEKYQYFPYWCVHAQRELLTFRPLSYYFQGLRDSNYLSFNRFHMFIHKVEMAHKKYVAHYFGSLSSNVSSIFHTSRRDYKCMTHRSRIPLYLFSTVACVSVVASCYILEHPPQHSDAATYVSDSIILRKVFVYSVDGVKISTAPASKTEHGSTRSIFSKGKELPRFLHKFFYHCREHHSSLTYKITLLTRGFFNLYASFFKLFELSITDTNVRRRLYRRFHRSISARIFSYIT